jgi:hypothetical protein
MFTNDVIFSLLYIDLQINQIYKKEETIMNLRGWHINLTGSTIPVYGGSNGYVTQGTQIGNLTANECFAEGTAFGAGWEGWGYPVYFRNSSGSFVLGAISSSPSGLKGFAEYASNGSSWVAVSTLQRKVQFATNAYYADGSFCCSLPSGSYVWLTSNCTRGQSNPNYVAVTKVQTAAGQTYTFTGNGFIDLVNGNWLNVGSILLRKV